MRILFVTQWFDPEPMFKGTKFLNALIARGHHVEVVTGFPNYPIGKLYPGYKLSLYRRETIKGLTVHRVPLYPSHDRSSIKRMVTYISFCFGAFIFCLLRARRFDIVYAYTPITTNFVTSIAARIVRRPSVIDVQDLWPDSVVSSGMSGAGILGYLINPFCKVTYRSATRIISQSRGIRQCLIERGVQPDKIDVIYNFADETAAVARGNCDLRLYHFEGSFNFVFGGNLGAVQGLDTLIRAAVVAAREVKNIRLLVIGNGLEFARLQGLVAELKAENVIVAPAVPSELIGDVFAAADVLVVHLLDRPLFAITIPSKTQFYLAMGKPLLVAVRGEAASFVVETGSGVAAVPQDVEAIAAAMVTMARLGPERLTEMGRCSREAYLRNFAFDRAVDATVRTLVEARQTFTGRP